MICRKRGGNDKCSLIASWELSLTRKEGEIKADFLVGEGMVSVLSLLKTGERRGPSETLERFAH